MIATRGPDITTPKVGRPSADSKRESMDTPMYEFIKDRLYFTTSSTRRFDTPSMHFFNVNNTLVYIPFFSDFGPMNVAHVYRFCLILHGKLESKQLAHKRIIFYSDPENTKRTNSAFLLCSYMIIVLGKSPDQAFAPFENVTPPFLQFRDAGYGPSTYHLSVLDCLRGLYKGLSLRLLRLDEFDVEEYEFYERVENGDFNWLTPKFIAFASPSDDTPPSPTSSNPSRPQTAFPALLSYFRSGNVKVVVRLNNKLYDETRFTELGIQHEEMYFPDGTCPPDSILRRFLRLCEETDGVIAVHCKAGLGRTGTLIAAYLMKHYRFTAAEVISFLRIMRPGSVVGPQQNYLASIEKRCWQLGEEDRIRNLRSVVTSPTSASRRNSTRRAIESNGSTPHRRVEKRAQENDQVQVASVPAESENSTSAAVLDQVELALANARKNKRHSSDGNVEAMSAMGEERLTIGVPVQPRKKLHTPERLAMEKIDVPMTREARVRTFSGTAQVMEREKERMLRERKERDEKEKKEILEKAKEAEKKVNTNIKGAKSDMETSRSDVSMAGSDVSMTGSKVDVSMGEPASLMGKSTGTSTVSSASTASSISTISTTPSSATSATVATRSGSVESSSAAAAAAAAAAASKTKIWKRSSRPTIPPTSTNTSSTTNPQPSSPVANSHRQSRYNLRSNTSSTQPLRERDLTRSPTPTQAPPLNRKQSNTSTLSVASSITSNTTAASGRRSPVSSVASIKNGVRNAVANATKKASNSMRRVVSMSVLPRSGNNSSSSAGSGSGTTGPVQRR